MLAATRLIALHKNKGMTVAACLKNRTDYIENPDKTEQGQYVSSYACSALTADEEFMLTKRQYDFVNGRRQKSDVIAYQIRQSFRPGEITAEDPQVHKALALVALDVWNQYSCMARSQLRKWLKSKFSGSLRPAAASSSIL